MKRCPFCAEEVQDEAKICRHCNADLVSNTRSTTVAAQGPAWSKGVAALLSFVIPGAGQMYKGQILNGLVWLVAVFVGYFVFIVPGIILHILCIFGAASGDTSKPTKSIGDR